MSDLFYNHVPVTTSINCDFKWHINHSLWLNLQSRIFILAPVVLITNSNADEKKESLLIL